MDFENLPDDWATRPLDHPELASGVVDLLLGHRDRARDSLLVLPCDGCRIGLSTPVVVADTDWQARPGERDDMLRFLTWLGDLEPPGGEARIGGAVVAVSSTRGLPYPLAAEWRSAVERALSLGGFELVAFASVSEQSVGVIGGLATTRVDPDRVRTTG